MPNKKQQLPNPQQKRLNLRLILQPVPPTKHNNQPKLPSKTLKKAQVKLKLLKQRPKTVLPKPKPPNSKPPKPISPLSRQSNKPPHPPNKHNRPKPRLKVPNLMPLMLKQQQKLPKPLPVTSNTKRAITVLPRA
ncbi:hypothetical protein [Moraxella nonliquefaciens]|uniref:hypothetical protein n=1 Tax=Moraxella nonliquefaciens TaxID=478 RepID=UPI003EDE8F59